MSEALDFRIRHFLRHPAPEDSFPRSFSARLNDVQFQHVAATISSASARIGGDSRGDLCGTGLSKAAIAKGTLPVCLFASSKPVDNTDPRLDGAKFFPVQASASGALGEKLPSWLVVKDGKLMGIPGEKDLGTHRIKVSSSS